MPTKIKPEFIPLYPVMDSLDDAWEFINSQLPITETNDLKGLIGMYHNCCVTETEARISKELEDASKTTS